MTDCVRCGRCCMNPATPIDAEDREYWRSIGRPDIEILAECGKKLEFPPVELEIGGETVRVVFFYYPCPFLHWDGSHNVCGIYDFRPKRCRTFEPGTQPICSQYRG